MNIHDIYLVSLYQNVKLKCPFNLCNLSGLSHVVHRKYILIIRLFMFMK